MMAAINSSSHCFSFRVRVASRSANSWRGGKCHGARKLGQRQPLTDARDCTYMRAMLNRIRTVARVAEVCTAGEACF